MVQLGRRVVVKNKHTRGKDEMRKRKQRDRRTEEKKSIRADTQMMQIESSGEVKKVGLRVPSIKFLIMQFLTAVPAVIQRI